MKKKYLVIGNPIEHSLSPELHNYWIKQNQINGIYEKKKLIDDDLKDLILEIKKKKINGINVTVPFKKKIIPYLDKLSVDAQATQSVNTVYLENNETIGHNTDIEGFENSIRDVKFDVTNKKILILGAGGVVASIVLALNKMKVFNITLSNRTRNNAENLKSLFKNLQIIDWGDISDFDMIINATSVGLNKNDKLDLDFSKIGKNKFFYDLIYNPEETNFLKIGRKLGNKTENGRMMFIYQASAAFKIWHGINPKINQEIFKFLSK
tara:strand:+ start:2978 stop:3775 length:798 start_codon:yes stop_codon:yes gene_type:complete